MPKATSSTQAKAQANTPTPKGNKWDMSRWTVTKQGSKGVTLFEALGITRGNVQYPRLQAQLPGMVGAQQNTQQSTTGQSRKSSAKTNFGGGNFQTAGGTPTANRALAQKMAAQRGWTGAQWTALANIWVRESGFRTDAANPSGAYGIPQALPGSKMASAGANWKTSASTQIKWGLDYIASRYGTPANAWAFWQAHGWY